MKNSNILRCICEGAILLAMGVVLSFIKVGFLPQGGSIQLVMVPLIVFSLRWGGGWGLAACTVYGVLDCIFSGGLGYGWQAIILDYAVAYGVVGVSGFFIRKPWLGVLAAGAAKYLVHIITGVIIWGEWMPEEFLGLSMSNVWVYSMLYNATYVIPNTILALVIVEILAKKTPFITRQSLKG